MEWIQFLLQVKSIWSRFPVVQLQGEQGVCAGWRDKWFQDGGIQRKGRDHQGICGKMEFRKRPP